MATKLSANEIASRLEKMALMVRSTGRLSSLEARELQQIVNEGAPSGVDLNSLPTTDEEKEMLAKLSPTERMKFANRCAGLQAEPALKGAA